MTESAPVSREVCLPGDIWYAIQTGVFSSEAAAQDKAGDFTDRGAPGSVVSSEGKWRVFIACYGRETDAAAVRQRLGEQRVETYLYHWQRPELRLRLTGMPDQLDVCEAGLMLLHSASALLRDTATLLDAGQMSVEDARLELAELEGQITLWQASAQEAFGRQLPQMLQLLMDASAETLADVKTMGSSAAAPAMSAALKGSAMMLYARLSELQDALISI